MELEEKERQQGIILTTRRMREIIEDNWEILGISDATENGKWNLRITTQFGKSRWYYIQFGTNTIGMAVTGITKNLRIDNGEIEWTRVSKNPWGTRMPFNPYLMQKDEQSIIYVRSRMKELEFESQCRIEGNTKAAIEHNKKRQLQIKFNEEKAQQKEEKKEEEAPKIKVEKTPQ
jgi:hypothetical protein